MNTYKKKLETQGHLLNAWLSIPSFWSAEVVAYAGFDVLTIDAQHGLATDLAGILPMLMAIEGQGPAKFVRLPANDPAFIMRMLDAGVQGLICPLINTRKDTEAFVAAAKYPPQGYRSFGPTRAGLIYGTPSEYFKKANEEVCLLAQIETADALKNIEEILDTPNLDGIYVGPWDLSIALGYSKHADFEDDSFLKILREIVEAAKKRKKMVGMHAGSPENGLIMKAMGFDFITIFNDSSALKAVSVAAVAKFNEVKTIINNSY